MPPETENNESQVSSTTETTSPSEATESDSGTETPSDSSQSAGGQNSVESDGGAESLLTGGDSESGEASDADDGAAPAPITKEDIMASLGENANEALVDKGFELMQEHGIGKEAGEALAQFMADYQQQAAEATAEAWEAQIEKWQTDAKADPDFGGDALDENLAKAKQLVQDYGDEDFTQMLSVLGVGNHPAMIRFILNVGKDLPSEGTPVNGSPKGQERSMADRLFGKSET